MNKLISIAKNTLILVNTIFIVYCSINIDAFIINIYSGFSFFVLVLSMIIILTIEIRAFVKKKTIKDEKYNIAFILVQSMILFIMLRNFFDAKIFLTINDLIEEQSNASSVNSFFLINNYMYINAMNLGLLLYYLINHKKIKLDA